MWVRFANSNYMESMDLLEELSAHKKSSTNQDGLKMIWINWPNFLGMHQEWIATLTQTAASLDELSKGVYVFLLEVFFCFVFFLHIPRFLFIK